MSKNAGVIAFQPANAAHRICSREMDLEEFNEDRIELKSSSEEISKLIGGDLIRDDSQPRDVCASVG